MRDTRLPHGGQTAPGSPTLWGVAALATALSAALALWAQLLTTGTRVVGYDFFNYHWNFWWVRHAWANGLDVYSTSHVFAPGPHNLGYHALTAFWFPLWALVEPLVGTLAAMNVILFAGAWLNGLLLFALLRAEGASAGVALLGGLALQTTPLVRYFYANTHINLMDWFWLPAHLLLWRAVVRAAEARRWPQMFAWAALQGVALWAALLTDHQWPIFLAFLLVPYGVRTLALSSARARLVAAGLVVVGVGVALAWFAGPLPAMLRFEGTLIPGTVADRPGVPLRGFLRPDAIWWHWQTPTPGAFLTVAGLGALLWTLVRRPRAQDGRWFWLWAALPPLILALGPTLELPGGWRVMMPYRALHALTDGMFRMPWRLLPAYLIAIALFAAKTYTPVLRGRGATTPILTAALLALVADVRLFQPPPLDMPHAPYAFYDAIRDDGYPEGVLLDVPVAAATGELIVGDARATQWQVHALHHERRVFNGFISRAPLEAFYHVYTDDPLLAWLGQRRPLDPADADALLRARVAGWPIGHVIVHSAYLDAGTEDEILGVFNALPDVLCPAYADGARAVAFRTSAHPRGCDAAPRTPPQVAPGVYTVDVGAPTDRAFLGWGWHYREDVAGLSLRWAGRHDPVSDQRIPARLHVDLPPGAYTATVRAQAYSVPRTLRLLVNGVPVAGEVTVGPGGLADYAFNLPADAIGVGRHLTIGLLADGALSPRQAGQGDDDRPLALLVDGVTFAAQGSLLTTRSITLLLDGSEPLPGTFPRIAPPSHLGEGG